MVKPFSVDLNIGAVSIWLCHCARQGARRRAAAGPRRATGPGTMLRKSRSCSVRFLRFDL